MTDEGSAETLIIDLKKVRFRKEDGELLRSLKKSGTSEHSTYASLVRLFVRMGLTLHRHGIHTVEQLESQLRRLSEPELADLEARITERVMAAIRRQPTPPKRRTHPTE